MTKGDTMPKGEGARSGAIDGGPIVTGGEPRPRTSDNAFRPSQTAASGAARAGTPRRLPRDRTSQPRVIPIATNSHRVLPITMPQSHHLCRICEGPLRGPFRRLGTDFYYCPRCPA